MAGLEALVSIIYHERQQQGSMLCAQHALNNVLQANYFTAPNLSDIGRNLDELEASYDDAQMGRKSANMDDTGFFSVQVLENALEIWGLRLVRWRSMDMRQYHDRPHTQLAFILNLQQHWFALRRFGPAQPDVNADPGHGHWFNLNSFLPKPEWVGRLYLGMVLHQAEEEGYSVFAVTQADPTKPLALPRTEADLKASELPEPTSAASISRLSTTTATRMAGSSTSQSATTSPPRFDRPTEVFEDEDVDLQAGIQASLASNGPDPVIPSPPALTRSYVPLPPVSGSHPSAGPSSGADSPVHSTRYHPYGFPDSSRPSSSGADKVAASMARNRAIMERMLKEQEIAQRELYEEEIARLNFQAAASARRSAEDQDEDDGIEGHGDDDDDDEEEEDEFDIPSTNTTDRARHYQMPHLPPMSSAHSSVRVYDDDDEALQQALQASLETVPPGFVLPNLGDQERPERPRSLEDDQPSELTEVASDQEDAETLSETDGVSTAGLSSSDAPREIEDVDIDEMRRRRLARFGG